MCHRFFVDEDTLRDVRRVVAAVSARLAREGVIGNDPLGRQEARTSLTGDINPADRALVITGRAPGLMAESMAWGFSRTGKKLRMINARAETAYEKPSFSESVERRRCVVPAAHFYEWDREKVKVTFSVPERRTLYLAGFYDVRDNEEQFVVLTTEANASMRSVHDRMPLILTEEQITDWIRDGEEARRMLRQPSPELQVSRDYEQLSLFDLYPQGEEE